METALSKIKIIGRTVSARRRATARSRRQRPQPLSHACTARPRCLTRMRAHTHTEMRTGLPKPFLSLELFTPAGVFFKGRRKNQ